MGMKHILRALDQALETAEVERKYLRDELEAERVEKQRLAAAAAAVSAKLDAMAAAMAGQVGAHAAEILAGQSMMLADPFMQGQMEEKIAGGATAEAAVDDIRRRFGYHSIGRAIFLTDTDIGGLNPREENTIHPAGWRRTIAEEET